MKNIPPKYVTQRQQIPKQYMTLVSKNKNNIIYRK